MVKSSKATKKFAKNHLAKVIKQRKEGKEKRKMVERIDNKMAKRKRSCTSPIPPCKTRFDAPRQAPNSRL